MWSYFLLLLGLCYFLLLLRLCYFLLLYGSEEKEVAEEEKRKDEEW